MGYDDVAAGLAIVDRQIADLKIRLDSNSEIVQQLDLVREFLDDRSTMLQGDLEKKWNDRFFDFYKAQLTVGVVVSAVTELFTNQQESLGKYLKVILSGSLAQGGPAGGQARDWFYELSLASVLSQAGFTVHFQEPDLVVEGNGLSQRMGIACKYPSSDKGIHEHLSKGLSQLKRHGMPGFIALGIDQIVVEKASLKKFVDFNIGGKNPIDVLLQYTSKELMTLVAERPEKYPDEDPVDEMLVTLSLAGHYGSPAKLISPTALSIHCSSTSPIKNDILIIAESLNELPGNQ